MSFFAKSVTIRILTNISFLRKTPLIAAKRGYETNWKSFKIMKKIENVNFRYRLGKQPIEIFNQLKTVCKDQAPSYAIVKNVRESICLF